MLADKILDDGSQVINVEGEYAYTVGRWTILGRPELLITGQLPVQLASYLLLSIEEELDLVANTTGDLSLVTQGSELPFSFEVLRSPVRLVPVDPIESMCFIAAAVGGKGTKMLQVVWEDAAGRWPRPWGPGTEPAQPVFFESA